MQRPREHDHEPVPGLPERLPQGERMLWQGRPLARRIAIEVLKVRWVAGYFMALIAWAIVAGVYDGRTWAEIMFAAGVLAALTAVVVGLIELYAWAVARTTLYTITDRRLVMRVGVGSSITFNLPFSKMAGASLLVRSNGSGTICFDLAGTARVSLFHMWPHVRPRHWSKPQPALRCIADAQAVAKIVVAQLSAASGAEAAPIPSSEPVQTPAGRPYPAVVGAAHA